MSKTQKDPDRFERRKNILLSPTQWAQLILGVVTIIVAFVPSIRELIAFQWANIYRYGSHGNEFHTSIAMKDQILPDGSSVFLNKGSEIDYSESEDKSTRIVTLTGEAFFDVKPDPDRPFVVTTREITITVLGTAFNINAYNETVKISVSHGKVKVEDDAGTSAIITRSEQLSVNAITDEFVKSKITLEEVMAWKDGSVFRLDNEPVGKVFDVISAQYGVTIIFTDPMLRNCKLTTKFQGSDLISVLDIIMDPLHAKYKIEGKNVVIRGRGCE